MAAKKEIPVLQIIIFLAVIVGLVYVVKTYVLKPKEEEKKDDSNKDSNASNNSSSSNNNSNSSTQEPPKTSSSGLPIKGNNTVLKKGDKAAEVKYIQYEYNRQHATPLFKTKLVEDGVFGQNTENAVFEIMNKKTTSYKEFMQKLKSLYPDDRNWDDDVVTSLSWFGSTGTSQQDQDWGDQLVGYVSQFNPFQ
jgi:hypothetical protein